MRKTNTWVEIDPNSDFSIHNIPFGIKYKEATIKNPKGVEINILVPKGTSKK